MSNSQKEKNCGNDLFDCPICYMPLAQDLYETKCPLGTHLFHKHCLERTQNSRCPLCRANLDPNHFPQQNTPNDNDDEVLQFASRDYYLRRFLKTTKI